MNAMVSWEVSLWVWEVALIDDISINYNNTFHLQYRACNKENSHGKKKRKEKAHFKDPVASFQYAGEDNLPPHPTKFGRDTQLAPRSGIALCVKAVQLRHVLKEGAKSKWITLIILFVWAIAIYVLSSDMCIICRKEKAICFILFCFSCL